MHGFEGNSLDLSDQLASQTSDNQSHPTTNPPPLTHQNHSVAQPGPSVSPNGVRSDPTVLLANSLNTPTFASLVQTVQTPALQTDFDWQTWLSSLTDEQRASLPTLNVPQYPPQQDSLDVTAGNAFVSGEAISVFNPSLPSNRNPSDPYQRAQSHSSTAIDLPTRPHRAPSNVRSTLNQPQYSLSGPTEPLSKVTSSTAPHRLPIHPNLPTSPTSGIESDEGSLEDAAKGLAMISLEAAAEPHYVGESSGSLWTTVISGGIHSQQHQQLNDGLKRHGATARKQAEQDIGPSKSTIGELDTLQAIQQPLPSDTNTLALETVFSHLHSRYPFMDWVRFEKQWNEKDRILCAVGQKFPLDRQSSTSAFFILMVLAVSAQLNRDRPLPGLLAPQQYYDLAMPYLSTIVTLHNLPNIQGLLLLAIYSLRDSKGPSVWYLSGVTLRLCIGMGLHRYAAGGAVRTLSKYDIEMRKRVFWSCYTIDRMISLLLGRPPGISDEDIDVDLPEVYEPIEKPTMESLQLSSMLSAIHHIRLKRIESRIQKAVYGIKRQPLQQAADYWELLNDLDSWESSIPAEASSPDHWQSPSCSRDWFLLKGVEARLHLLRPLCAEGQSAGAVFVTHLAAVAARGCEIQKRMHQQGLPMSNASAHSAFICGLALLYALFLQPKVLPLKDVFRAIKATSNTLFTYAQHAHQSVEVLFDVFEDLSAACIEHISRREVMDKVHPPEERRSSVEEWQKASSQATSNLDPAAAGEYVNILETLGFTVTGDSSGQAAYTEPLWDLAAFSPGNLFPFTGSTAAGF
ncbi:uncharacterized protein I303_104851 [Kwoniella dejecticola CBS 10117]|uniref:Xylanolytic transcriptional activator regulatory domain-containing protein n=1 Tax=Kwoniella dejecticola CBS 10117 TaxID=1296121 RepID=A0A1A6A462_9TREE|nr:uncharacterized protein I303_04166 [Kwoniella dejecticola CBS 10117]OBR84845.1 hypothetical protein I303_04166 [Kwoniella dejecticola CBS 10117]